MLVAEASSGWSSFGVFHDEGARVFGGHSMRDAFLATTATHGKVHGGEPFTDERIGDGKKSGYEYRDARGFRMTAHIPV